MSDFLTSRSRAKPHHMADPPRIWTAALVIIGDEILSGRTQDTNLAYLGKWLNLQGIQLAEARVVPDQMGPIAEAVNACRAAHDYVFTTGGIGPTHDDISVDAIAAALGVPVVLHPKAEAILRGYYGDRITEARLRMARVPAGRRAHRQPGVGRARHPHRQHLHAWRGCRRSRRACSPGSTASSRAARRCLTAPSARGSPKAASPKSCIAVERERPGVQIGSYPFWREGKVGANFVVRSQDRAALDDAAARLIGALVEAGHAPIDGAI